jgi:hypothetical protein
MMISPTADGPAIELASRRFGDAAQSEIESSAFGEQSRRAAHDAVDAVVSEPIVPAQDHDIARPELELLRRVLA